MSTLLFITKHGIMQPLEPVDGIEKLEPFNQVEQTEYEEQKQKRTMRFELVADMITRMYIRDYRPEQLAMFACDTLLKSVDHSPTATNATVIQRRNDGALFEMEFTIDERSIVIDPTEADYGSELGYFSPMRGRPIPKIDIEHLYRQLDIL
jgi:hypothetical protein